MTRWALNRIFVFSALLLIFAIKPVTGYSADKWLKVRSRNFILVGDAPEDQIRRVARNLEQFREAFALLIPNTEKGSSIPTIVIVFKNDGSFQPYKPIRDGKTLNVNGYFQGSEDTNFIVLTGSMNSPSAILHEYVHSLMKDYAGGLPSWINEGVAEYYSTFEITNKDREFNIGATIQNHITGLNGNSFIPFQTLFTVDHSSPYYNEKDKQGAFYSESWALVHYLMLGKNKGRQPQFLKFLSLMTSEQSFVEMFSEAFQTDYGTLERELRDYTRGKTSLPSMRLVLRDSLVIDKEMTTAPVSDSQAEYYLGNLLYHAQRLPEAELHLQKAISLDPNFGAAYASMGMIRASQKQFPEALSFLKRAIGVNSPDYIVHYDYATLLDQLDREDALPEGESTAKNESMRTHLMKSIELDPTFLQSYKLLANLNLVSNEQLGEAETMLRNALSIAPGRQDLALLLAQTMLRLNKAPGARTILIPLTRSADDPEVQKQAELVLKNVDLYSGDLDAIRESLARREIVGEKTEQPPAEIAKREVAPRTRKEPVIEPVNPITRVVDGEQVTGLLVMLDCASGLTLRIRADQQTVDLHTNTPGNLEFLSYTSGVSNNITCGPRNPGTPVRVTYRKETREPLIVEFIEQNPQ